MSGAYKSMTEATIPFVITYVAEVLDRRLDLHSLRLLLLLRHRCGGNESVWASHQTLADDLGIGHTTVRDAAAKLTELGFLRSEQTSKHISTDKHLMPPYNIYDSEVLLRPNQFLRTVDKRTDVDLRRMHSLPLTEEEKKIPPPRIRLALADEFNGFTECAEHDDQPLSARRHPPVGAAAPPMSGLGHPPVGAAAPNNNKATTTQKQEPTIREEPLRGYSTTEEVPIIKDQEGSIETLSSYSELKPRVEPDSHMALVRANFERQREEIADNVRRKQRAKQDGSGGYEAAQRKLAKDEAKAERAKARPPGAKTAELWFKERHKAYYPSVTFVRWSGKEMKWAVDMIGDYGPKKLQRAFDYVFDNWDRYRQDYAWMKLGLVPGLDFLYRERRNIMAEVETLFKDDDGQDKESDSGTFF